MPGFTKILASKFQRSRGPRDVRWVVIHTMEAPESPTMAERVGSWWQRGGGYGVHYAVDCDSIVQAVEENDIAWHAAGANEHSIGIEHAARAAQLPGEWGDAFSTAMLRDVSAPLLAGICRRWAIPIIKIDAAAMRRGERGIVGHADVAAAFGKTTHWDPGLAFPWTRYLEWARTAAARGSATHPVPAGNALAAVAAVIESIRTTPVRRGEQSERVRLVQKLLVRAGRRVAVDGDFGAATETAVRHFQVAHKLPADGVVGRRTIDSLLS